MALDFNSLPFIQARWYTNTGSTGRERRKIVIHSMEAPEKGDTAEATARYFAGLPATRKASAHYCVDNNSVVQTVQTKDVAFAAPGANHDGIHIELAGYARQTRSEWEDSYSLAMLEIAADLCRFLSPRFGIPAVFLTAKDLKANPESRGCTTHAEVTKAFHRSTHTDPGTGFPMDWFLSRVKTP
jgi:N-acetyl-anhydromuramyl-L-alanine amidase AmpD